MVERIPEEWGELIPCLCGVWDSGRAENCIWVWQKFSLYEKFIPRFRENGIHKLLLSAIARDGQRNLDAQIRAAMCLGNILKDIPEHPALAACGRELLQKR